MSTQNISAPPVSAPPSLIGDPRRWLIVGLLFAASLINYFDRTTVSFALPIIARDLHLGPNEKGTLIAAFFWSYAIMQIPMGILADRFNLRWLYACAFVLWSVAQGLTGFANSLAMLVLFRVLLGIGEAIYLPGGTRVVSLFFPLSERAFPSGLFDFGTRSGMVLEGIIIPSMILAYGWRNTFAVVGFAALLWLIPWLAVTPRQMRAPPEPAQERLPLSWPSFLGLLGNRNLIGICLGFFCFDYYWYVLVSWLPDYMFNVRHLTLQWAGIYTALPLLIFGMGQPLGGWIADRLVRAGWDETRTRKGIVSLAFLTGLLLIPATQAGSAKVALVLIMAGCLVGFSTANQLVILQSCAPAAQIGLWVGIFNFVGNIAGIVAAKLTGHFIAETNSYTPAFVLAALIIAVGQLSFWFIVGPLRTRHEGTLTS